MTGDALLIDQLRALVEQWRTKAAQQGAMYASGLTDCADDVERLLGPEAPHQEEKPPCVRCGATESSDGDWYRLCGKCRWEAPEEPQT